MAPETAACSVVLGARRSPGKGSTTNTSQPGSARGWRLGAPGKRRPAGHGHAPSVTCPEARQTQTCFLFTFTAFLSPAPDRRRVRGACRHPSSFPRGHTNMKSCHRFPGKEWIPRLTAAGARPAAPDARVLCRVTALPAPAHPRRPAQRTRGWHQPRARGSGTSSCPLLETSPNEEAPPASSTQPSLSSPRDF